MISSKGKLQAIAAAMMLPWILSAAALAQDVVHIGGAVTKPTDWTPDQIRQQFASDIKPIDYTSKDQKHTSDCVPLLSILKAAGVPTTLKPAPGADPKNKNIPLRMSIVVQGRDGYQVVFSVAELLPDFGKRDVWVALDEDGSPLSDRDEPAKLIVPEDAKPGRWVHGIAAITVIDQGIGTTQPTASTQP
jgi:hypothetical protein